MTVAPYTPRGEYAGTRFDGGWSMRLDMDRGTYSLCRPDGSPVAVSIPEADAGEICNLINYGASDPGRRDSNRRVG